jgi:hypothetical protein
MIPFEDESQKYQEDSKEGFHVDYMMYNRYDADLGVYAAGITSPDGFGGGSCAIMQLSAGVLIKAADWTAARLGERPTVPSPDLNDPGWELLRVMPEAAMVTVAPNGVTPLYRVNGTYFYAKKSAADDALDDVTFPKPSWLKDGEARRLPPEFRIKGLIDPAGAASSSARRAGAGGVAGANVVRQRMGFVVG